jgi:murein DD-endopeptidase MepM/ murein hydrolase activator NlpD
MRTIAGIVAASLLGTVSPSAFGSTASELSSPSAVPPAAIAPIAPAVGFGAADWRWPVIGPVIDPYDPPETPFGAGHRGIDIAAGVGTPIVAPAAATVAFAGKVGGQLFVTLDHGGGLESTYSWLSSILVAKRDVVAAGQPIALTGGGHPGSSVPHLHLGVKLNDAYQDPMAYLGAISVSSFIRLAPS